jgi:Trypsin-co-occurring domain 1
MTNYIRFEAGDEEGSVVLIEVDEEEIESELGGTSKIGLKDIVNGTIATAQKSFATAIRSAIKQNVQGLIEGVRNLPDPPSEIEITFGLKATGEVGNIAVGKAGAETNYTIKLVWKQTTHDKQ